MSVPSRTRKALVAGIAAVTLGTGAIGVAALGPAGAQSQEDPGGGGRGSGVLEGLVADGTITEAQADAIRERVREHREEHPGRGRSARLLRGALTTAAEAIGIEPEALRERVKAGESIAAVAESEGVERQAVVDALVAAGSARLDEAVADGRITQEQADRAAERLPDLAARVVDHTREPR